MSIDITTLAIAKEYTNRMIGSGGTGSGGGYYTPGVTQPTTDTMQISFAPSKSDMPAVDPVTVNLPVSENSGQNVELDSSLTKSGEAADAKAVGDALDKLEEKIPSIEGLAKTEDIPTKPEDIGAQPQGNYASPDDVPKVPNWAMQASKPGYTASEVGADPNGTAETAVSAHSTNEEAHPDIRLEIKAIREQLAAFLDVDEETLNELSELIARIVANQTSIAQLTTGKVNVTDIIDNLTTNVANKPLSAAQGVALKALIDGLASGKLDASKLTEAVNAALAQAKASGEFDGAKGDPGQAATFEITGATALAYGAAPTITEQNDSTAQARKYVVGIPAGKPGTNGYTPVRGVDYWTPDDIAAFDADIATELAKRGQLKPEFANSIEECTDTSKLYVLPDSYIYAYMLAETAGGAPLFTNLADPDSADWQADKRFSSSSGAISACTGTIVSNVITMKKGDTIRVKGLRDGSSTATSSAYVGLMGYSDAAGTTKLWGTPMFFNKTKAQNTGGVKDLTTIEDGAYVYTGFPVIGGDGTVVERDGSASVVCVRVSGEPVTNVDDIIVTVNEEIAYSSASTGYQWKNTGHAFVPSDYEDRIIELEKTQSEHTTKIAALEKAVESGSTDETEAAALARIKNWDKPVYDRAPLTLIPDDRAKAALPESEKTVEAVYAKYRALMAKYPDYITETNLGLSSSSDTFAAVDILRFDFKEPDGRVEAGYVLNETKPKIIFMTGVHNEYAGIYGLYYALEEIAENPDFKDIRRNAHIIVIPCSNPHCLGGAIKIDGWQMSHVNANGVAIHNNFGVDFGKGNATATLGEYNYGGTEPYSEPETQYIDKVLRENTDAIAFVSCHNFNYGVKFASDFVWMSSATAHMCNLAFRLIDKLTAAWMGKYGDTYTTNFDAYRDDGTETYAAGDYRIGRATYSTSGGTEAKNATKYGILGTNLEIGDRMRVVSGNTTYTSETMTHGAEVYANFMRTLLWSYDHKDKNEYAPNLPWSE